jgi:hypothetical protein
VADGLSAAEEVFDLQTTNERFQGEDYPLSTGRVVLHACRMDGLALCGRSPDGLVPAGHGWDGGYLPHLARCRPCALAAGSGAGPATQLLSPDELAAPPPGMAARGIHIRTARGSDLERAGADVLRAALAGYDIRQFLLTDLAWVDEEIRGGVSHPLMLSPRLLLRGPDVALTVFLHEQMHWIQGPGLDAATTEAAARWPQPPPPPAGAHDAESSWLHFSVCALEYASLYDLIGAHAAGRTLSEPVNYSWIYGQILGDPDWFADFLRRHGLRAPGQPPVPRRYYGDDWWKIIPGVSASR